MYTSGKRVKYAIVVETLIYIAHTEKQQSIQ